MLKASWPPVRDTDEETCAWLATRVATLLGSGAPLRALVADLGRIRVHELALDPDPRVDEVAAKRIQTWFEAESV